MELRARRDERIGEATPEEILKLVEKFSGEIINELGSLIKSVVWFGSQVKRPFTDGKKKLNDESLYGSDIDVLLLFDDLIHAVTPEVITAYRVVVEKIAAKVSARLHITTMPITKYWEYASKGDPILINMLREGISIFDTGSFGMGKQLLNSGQIKPTSETVWAYLSKSPNAIGNSKWNIRQAALQLYYAVIDASHSALLSQNIVPDSHEHLIDLFEVHLIKQNLIDKSNLNLLKKFIKLSEDIHTGKLNKLTGKEYDKYNIDARIFIRVIHGLITNR